MPQFFQFQKNSTSRAFVIAMAGSALAPATALAAQGLPPITISDSAVRQDLAPSSAQNPFRITESSTSHTQTITREEIEDLRPRDVFELLNNATGVIATQGSRKGFSGLSIRGDSNFRWIVDGAYLQPNMAGRIMRGIPVTAIEEVTQSSCRGAANAPARRAGGAFLGAFRRLPGTPRASLSSTLAQAERDRHRRPARGIGRNGPCSSRAHRQQQRIHAP